MDLIVIAAVLLLAAIVLVAKLKSQSQKGGNESYSYRVSGPLLTAAERSFYGVLAKAVSGEFEIHPKVRVADVLAPAKGLTRSDWQKSFNKISSKHFDFALCDPATLQVKKVIELNDASHKRVKRAARDRFLIEACESANLELKVFAARKSYSVVELREQLTTG